MPRVRVKPWTLYEEALGLKNCKRVSWGLSGVVLGNLVAGKPFNVWAFGVGVALYGVVAATVLLLEK